MDSSQHHEPQRLSALYQYHNAPEVAPAHGLEYDDTIYPSSDKYPVVSERIYDLKRGKYGIDNRPPRIIFGMKVKTFLVVALVMILVVVGAAVGGAVGGQSLRSNQQFDTLGSATATGSATSTSTFVAATPTYTPLEDCPESNNTTYTSSFTHSTAATPQAPDAGLHFTKYCDVSNPLSLAGAARISEAFVYSFSDCIEVCAGYNYWNDNANCTVAVYQSAGSRPGNCWVGHAANVAASSLSTVQGTDVAILLQGSS